MRKVLALLLSVVMALSLMVNAAWADPVEQDLYSQNPDPVVAAQGGDIALTRFVSTTPCCT